MNTERPNEDDLEPRKFDDVASLFGGIVPPAGTPVRPGPKPRPLPQIPDPSGPVALSLPPRLPPRPDLAEKWAAEGESAAPADLPAATDRPTAIRADLAPLPTGVATPIAAEPAEPGNLEPASNQKRDKRGRSGQRTTKSNIPWPDAFEPQPNFRRGREAQSWAWFLLIPLIGVIAIGVLTVDPAAIRAFVDKQFPQFQKTKIADVDPLVPAPFRRGSATTPGAVPADPAASPPAAANAAATDDGPLLPPVSPSSEPSTAAGPPQPADAAQGGATQAAPTPSAPTPSAPAPDAAQPNATTPGATAQDAPTPATPPGSIDGLPAAPPAPANVAPLIAPAAPSPQAASPPAAETVTRPAATPALETPSTPVAPAVAQVVVVYRRGQSGSEAEGRKVMAQLQSIAGRVELRAAASTLRTPSVLFSNPGDKEAATSLARTLGGEHPFAVRPGNARNSAGTLEVWVP